MSLVDPKYRDFVNSRDWMANVPCKKLDGSFADYLFFPERNMNVNSGILACHICNQCPLRRVCLDYQIIYEVTHGGNMLWHPGTGIFGGTFPKKRHKVLRPLFREMRRERGDKNCRNGRVIYTSVAAKIQEYTPIRFNRKEWTKFEKAGQQLFEESKCYIKNLNIEKKRNPIICFYCKPVYKTKYNFWNDVYTLQEIFLAEGAYGKFKKLLTHRRTEVT